MSVELCIGHTHAVNSQPFGIENRIAINNSGIDLQRFTGNSSADNIDCGEVKIRIIQASGLHLSGRIAVLNGNHAAFNRYFFGSIFQFVLFAGLYFGAGIYQKRKEKERLKLQSMLEELDIETDIK